MSTPIRELSKGVRKEYFNDTLWIRVKAQTMSRKASREIVDSTQHEKRLKDVGFDKSHERKISKEKSSTSPRERNNSYINRSNESVELRTKRTKKKALGGLKATTACLPASGHLSRQGEVL